MPNYTFNVVINIPSPYRIFFFEKLNKKLHQHGISLQVFFLADTEPGRYWGFREEKWGFTYNFGRGPSPSIAGSSFHIKPNTLIELAKNPPNYLLLCGGWFIPGILSAAIIGKLSKKTQTIFWSESNLFSKNTNSFLIGWLRGKAYSMYDVVVYPGIRAREYFEDMFSKKRPFSIIQMPNVVDEHLYIKKVDEIKHNRTNLRNELGIQPDQIVFFTAARLTKSKGLVEFITGLSYLSSLELKQSRFYIAGDGDAKEEIHQLVEKFQLGNSVKFLGHLNQLQMIKYLAISDVFFLASLYDPYPLAVIEAAFSGLPLLLSEFVGCHPEILNENINGWVMNPYLPASISEKIQKILTLPRGDLSRVGMMSRKIANSKFESDVVIDKFLQELGIC